MSTDTKNPGFEQGTLQGYSHSPRTTNNGLELVEVHKNFQIFGLDIQAPEGQFFARLDHPEAVNEDGAREKNNEFHAEDLTNLSFPHADGHKTRLGTGAWLDCPNVTISKGECLWFWYRFLRFGESRNGHNAIALLLLYPHNNTQNSPARKILICDNRKLENENKATDSGWVQRSVTISSTREFSGTVRWVMATGHLVPPGGRVDHRRFGLPGTLFLDLIDIR